MLSIMKTACFDDNKNNSRPSINQFFSLTDSLMHYCHTIESQHKGQPQYHYETPPSPRVVEIFEILDELDHVGLKYMNSCGYHRTNNRDTPQGLFQKYQQNSYLGVTVQARLSLYVQKQPDEEPIRLHKRGRPLLDYALRPTIVTPIELPGVDHGPVRPIFELLLDWSAESNQQIYIYDDQTPWGLQPALAGVLRPCYSRGTVCLGRHIVCYRNVSNYA